MNDRDDLLDEATLRRALRFEADEPLPRFDPRMIAAAARAVPATRLAFVALAAAFVTGVVAATVWSAAIAAGPQVADGVVPFVLPPLVAAATWLLPVVQAATQPIVPLSLIAALAVATAYELRERREGAHAHAS